MQQRPIYRWALLLVLATLVRCAVAGWSDDVTNNLLTDLGPILTLLGEKVTLQFFGILTGHSGVILLSIAPMGLLTILVSAIRVAGPAWLRTVIGRARENFAAAEMEILSSTSHEVCELWNGHSVVRCMGTAEMVEFICLLSPDSRTSGDVPIVTTRTMQEIENDGYLEKLGRYITFSQPGGSSLLTQGTERTVTAAWRRFRLGAWSGVQRDSTMPEPSSPTSPGPGLQSHLSELVFTRNASEDSSAAPNVLLNAHNKLNRSEWRWLSVVLVVTQFSAIMFVRQATFFWRWQKEGEQVEQYSFPCYVVGTLVMMVGTMLCANVVEGITVEKSYRVTGKREVRMIWVQKKQRVNDQSFESCAVFTGAPQQVIATSTRTDNAMQPPSWGYQFIIKALIKMEEAASCMYSLLRLRNRSKAAANPQVKAWAEAASATTVMGTTLAIVGYIVQFTGLRGLHFSAILSQTGSMLIGLGLRTFISRNLAKSLSSQSLPDGFELDWLAMTMNNLSETPWLASKTESAPRVARDKGNTKGWRIVTANNRTRCLALGNARNMPVLSPAQSIMSIRQQFGQLADWKSTVSEEAVMLAAAIETVMNTFFFSRSDYPEDDLLWTIDAHHDGSQEPHPIHFIIKRRQRKWQVRADKLEAALSLWLYTAQELKKEDDLASEDVDGNGDMWLRAKGMTPKPSLRLLGPRTDQLHRDLQWWLPLGIASVNGITKLEASARSGQVAQAGLMNDNQDSDLIEIRNEMIVGHGTRSFTDTVRQTGRTQCLSVELSPLRFADGVVEGAPASDQVLATVQNNPLSLVYVQDMFSAFMWSAAKYLKSRVSGGVDIRHNNAAGMAINGNSHDWQGFTLRNACLTRMMQDLQGTGLGNLDQMHDCVIPPLSVERKLPLPEGIVELAREHAREHEQLRQWKQATDVYLWLLRVTQTFDGADAVAYQAVAVAGEFHRVLVKTIHFKKSQCVQQEDIEIDAMEPLREAIETELNKIDQTVLNQIGSLYRAQGREHPFIQGNECKNDMLSTVGLAEIHRLAAEAKENGGPLLHYLNTERRMGTINLKDAHHWTPLHYVTAMKSSIGLVAAVEHLLLHGADVNAQDVVGWTPLHYACHHTENLQLVTKMISHGASLEVLGRDGITPLHCAAANGCLELAEALVEAGAEIDIPDSWGNTALLWAIIRGHLTVVEYLWDKANRWRRDHGGRTVLHLMAANGRADMLKFVRDDEGQLPPPEDGQGQAPPLDDSHSLRRIVNVKDGVAASALCLATYGGHFDAVDQLIGLGANPSDWDTNSVYLREVAAAQGFHNIAALLEQATKESQRK